MNNANTNTNKSYLTPEQLREVVVSLSMSQGFYCRVLESMNSNWEAWVEELTDKFVDDLDFILWLEQ